MFYKFFDILYEVKDVDFCFTFTISVFQSDSDIISSIFCGLESIHAALAVMAHNEMPKQLYKEEVNAYMRKLPVLVRICHFPVFILPSAFISLVIVITSELRR